MSKKVYDNNGNKSSTFQRRGLNPVLTDSKTNMLNCFILNHKEVTLCL